MPVNRLTAEGEMPVWRQLAWFEPEEFRFSPHLCRPRSFAAHCAVPGRDYAACDAPAVSDRTSAGPKADDPAAEAAGNFDLRR
jgi:hypothetical protein